MLATSQLVPSESQWLFWLLYPCYVCLYWWTTDPADPYRITDNTRNIGLVVCRGTQVSFLSPVEGIEEIANPFTEEELGEEEEEIRVEA